MPHLLMTTAIIALSTAGVVEAQAADYYVATSGNDSNAGTQAAPFRTINHALSVAGADDTVYVRGGTYAGVRFLYGGAPEQPLTLRNYPGERPVIEPGPCDGSQPASHGIDIKHNDGHLVEIGWIVIQGLEIRCGYDGIKIYNTHDLIVRDNRIHDSWEQGVLGWGLRVLIERNVIAQNGTNQDRPTNQLHGIYLEGTDITIQNNLIYDNLSWGIAAVRRVFDPSLYARPEYAAVTNWLIQYNTIALNGYRGGIVVWSDGAPTENVAIDSNIFYRNRLVGTISSNPHGIMFWGNGGQVHPVRGNIFFGEGDAFYENAPNSYMETGSLYVDPELFDPESGDFRPMSGSPVIDNAFLYGPTPPATDIALTSRPQGLSVDIGAHEF